MKKEIKKLTRKLLPKFYDKLVRLKQGKTMEKFKQDYPTTRIFDPVPANEMKLHSFDNQDFIVYENFFKGKKDGIFCDIGGNHPLRINNTLYFEEQGWSGIAFEPLPRMAKLWAEHRKAKLFPVALSDKEGEVIFTVVKGEEGWEDMLSFVKETREAIEDRNTEEIRVQTKVFKDLIKEENITHIDYLSLDVEGHEINVLNGIDFDAVRIDVLTIENCPPGLLIYGDDNIRKIMFENNFELWGRITGLDDIYVNKDFLKTLQKAGS